MRSDTDQFLQLFLQDTPFIDTRAPIEFAKGSFPGAVNLPLMLDDERARVGTCYKQKGQQAAIELGHQLVHGEVKTQRVQAWTDFAKAHPGGYLYCFRGGLRSQICTQWMREAGHPYPRITGGYKAMRRFLLDQMEMICQKAKFVVLAGRTGCAKTDLLLEHPHHLDLEGLANHRGSAFGKRVGGQPSQIDFENRVAVALLRLWHKDPGRPILVEDESFLIGRCALPEPLRLAMEESEVVLLETSNEQRVEHSFRNYILHNLADWQDELGPEAGFNAFAEELRQSLGKIRRRLGDLRYRELSDQLETGLAAHQGGDDSAHKHWIRTLLLDYYDPMYGYQLEKKQSRLVFTGSPDQVLDYLDATISSSA